MQLWKSISGAEDYEVSNLGNIRRATAGNGGQYPAGLEIKQRTDRDGYKRVGLRAGSRFLKPKIVHKIVAIAFIGDGRGRQVNHKNGNRTDNRLENLEWVTRKENMHHMRYRFWTMPISDMVWLAGAEMG